MTDNEFCNELHKRAEEYFLECQKEFAIKELEKIIIEIGNIEETKTYIGNIVFKNPQEIKDEVMEILDKRISKLKGESNAE